MCCAVLHSRKLRAMQLKMLRAAENRGKAKRATPSTPGTNSNAVAESDALPSLHWCYSAQNPSKNPAPNAICNINPRPQFQHQLARPDHQDYESSSANRVQQSTVPNVSNVCMYTAGNAENPGTDFRFIDSLSSPSNSNSGTLPATSSAWTNVADTSDPVGPLVMLPLQCPCCSTVSPRSAEADFRSIDSLSSPYSPSSSNSGTQPATPRAWTNVADTSIPVMLPPQCLCGNCQAIGLYYNTIIYQQCLNDLYLMNETRQHSSYVQRNSSVFLC
jgi:hypothetical protein